MIKILIDENLPLKLKFRFGNGFEVLTINDMGWNAKKNGEIKERILDPTLEKIIHVS